MSGPLDPAVLSPAVATLVEEAQRSERAGQREIARRRYETALYLLRPGEASAAAASAMIRRVARTFIEEGRFDVALECLEAAMAVAEANADQAGIAHTLNLTAMAHGHRGEVDHADALYARALAVATAAGDPSLRAMIAQNLGISASVRGDHAAALDHYASSLVIYRTAGMREYLGPVLNNMGLAYTQLDRLDEAHAAYDEALTHCAATDDTPNRLLALTNSTTLWLARGELGRAAALCDAVIAEATTVGDHRALAEAHKHLGVVARMRGDSEAAERLLQSAYDDAMRREDLLLAAETSRERAVLYESMDRGRETLQALTQSHRLFAKLRARRDLADLRGRVTRLERQFHDVVMRWAQRIESKDAYTLGHCERVADYACALARDVGFDDITMFWFRIGALLHDVGKVVVPSEVLNKAGLYTAEERAIMERHAAAGSELLADIDFPWDVLPMVRGHHERWDGTGYPDRLAGARIDLTARITCIADVFDALTTDRPYRRGFSQDEALAMMTKDSGRLFDPELFPRFVRLVRAQVIGVATAERLAAAS